MSESRKTKTQQRLEGRTIVQVVHAPRELLLELDDGLWFAVKAVEGQDKFDPWSRGPSGLDFGFKKPTNGCAHGEDGVISK